MARKLTLKQKKLFVAYMRENDHDDLPDGAWFAVLEESAERFFKEQRIRMCPNDGAHLYIQLSEKLKK